MSGEGRRSRRHPRPLQGPLRRHGPFHPGASPPRVAPSSRALLSSLTHAHKHKHAHAPCDGAGAPRRRVGAEAARPRPQELPGPQQQTRARLRPVAIPSPVSCADHHRAASIAACVPSLSVRVALHSPCVRPLTLHARSCGFRAPREIVEFTQTVPELRKFLTPQRALRLSGAGSTRWGRVRVMRPWIPKGEQRLFHGTVDRAIATPLAHRHAPVSVAEELPAMIDRDPKDALRAVLRRLIDGDKPLLLVRPRSPRSRLPSRSSPSSHRVHTSPSVRRLSPGVHRGVPGAPRRQTDGRHDGPRARRSQNHAGCTICPLFPFCPLSPFCPSTSVPRRHRSRPRA